MMNKANNIPYNKTCDEQPTDCMFRFAEYRQGETFTHGYEDAHYIVYCRKGTTKLRSNLFKEEVIYGGEILFLPRMADCRGEIMDDSHVIIHIFNNTVCKPENCILSYLYKHNRQAEHEITYRCKLTSPKALDVFMDGISHYLSDQTDSPQLWRMKHRELIHLLCLYYRPEELQSFFNPMIGEDVPFKSLVLSHYQRVKTVKELADICGYGLYTFRRIFKKEFAVSAYQWLIKKRSEHILHKLSIPHISFSDIINEFNFSSSAHFSHFCKKFLGNTPGKLRDAILNRYKKK